MRVLVIGTDRSIFDERSPARKRIDAYAELFDELHVVVLTPPGLRASKVRARLALYPTNSRNVFRRPFDAASIGERIIRERGIGCISVQDPSESGFAGWLLKRRTRRELHIQMHTDILNRAFRRNSWKERIRYYLARFVIRRGDRFRVVSERIRASLLAFGIPDGRIRVLSIFVDARAIAAASPAFNLRERYPEFRRIVLVVARLVSEKNIPLALEVLMMLLGECPDAGLVVVGDGPKRRDIEESIREWGLLKHVRMVGWQEDLIPYYQGADCYLLTSNFEGYGRSVVEAAASGTPVVMTDVGVAGDIIRNGETGAVAPIGESGALARALGRALRDGAAARAMAARAKREVLARPPQTWDAYLARYRDSFR